MIIHATEKNLDDIVEIEKQFFGGAVSESPPITKEEYGLFFKLGGNALVRYSDNKPTGLLAYIKPANLTQEIEKLDKNSVLYKNYIQKEIMEKYSSYLLIFSWAGLTKQDAILFREVRQIGKKLFGFVDLDNKEAMERYQRFGGQKKEIVKDLYVSGKTHAVIIYEKIEE